MIGQPPRDVLTKIDSTDFLQACTLLHTRELRHQQQAHGARGKDLPQITCKRAALLTLPLEAYKKYAEPVEAGFIEAASFLNENKIIWYKDTPYPPLLIGLACVFAIMDAKAQSARAKQQLNRWFWSVTLGELYGSSTESRLARDVPALVHWLDNPSPDAEPGTLNEAVFQSLRLDSLRTRNSAAYKGIHALLMRQGCRDFITGKATDIMTFFNDDIDIHHIFPTAWCRKNGIDHKVHNSIVNKTPLSRLSNISIGGRAPSIYLERIEHEQGITAEALDDILRSHLINPKYLRNDDFEAFYSDRKAQLETLIGKAMGKPVVRDAGANEPGEIVEDDDEADVI